MAIRRRKAAKQFAVVGLGRFGSSVARTLYRMGYEVLAIDSEEGPVQELANTVTHAVQADSTDEAAMRALGIRNFDVVVVAIGDLQASILTTIVLQELGVPRIVAKATSELHGKVLEKVGATRVVYPERDMGVRVAQNLISGNMIEYLPLVPGYSIVEVKVKDVFIGKTLKQLDFRAKYGINVVGIRRGEDVIIGPGAEDVLLEGDTMIAVGRDEMLERLEEPSES